MAAIRRWVFVMLLVLLAASGLVGSAPALAAADQAVMIQLKGAPGDEMHYRTEATFTMEITVKDPASGNTTFTIAPNFQGQFLSLQRIQAVSPEGNMTLAGRLEALQTNLTVGDLRVSLALAGPEGSAARFPRLPELPIHSVMSPRGALVSITGLEKLPIPPLPAGPGGQKIDLRAALPKIIALVSRPVYPDHPVRPGESWQTEFSIDPQAIMEAIGIPMPPEAAAQMKAGKFAVTIASTLTGFETVNGVRTAVIRAEVPWQRTVTVGPAGGEQATMSQSGRTLVVTNFDYAAGRKAREQTNSRFEMSVGRGPAQFVLMTMQIQATTNLVP